VAGEVEGILEYKYDSPVLAPIDDMMNKKDVPWSCGKHEIGSCRIRNCMHEKKIWTST
jgi:hypothetical protein